MERLQLAQELLETVASGQSGFALSAAHRHAAMVLVLVLVLMLMLMLVTHSKAATARTDRVLQLRVDGIRE
nr:hypothetical protein [uncultured Albidiferax sp.]